MGWNPIGESWATIAHKLIVLNQLDSGSYNQLCFGKPCLRSGLSVANALRAKDYELQSIFRLTDWKPSQLRASFIDFLLAFDSHLSSAQHIDSKIKISRRLRVCPMCFIEGIHLTFHQCLDFGWCPLHFKPLTDSCPQCDLPLSEYGVPVNHSKMRVDTYFNCSHCGNGGLGQRTGHKNDLLKKKAKLVIEYGQWCRGVQQETSHSLRQAKHDFHEIVWRSNCETFSDIKKLTNIYESPSWLRQSLFGTEHRTVQINQYDLQRKIPKRKGNCGDTITSANWLKLQNERAHFHIILNDRMRLFEKRISQSKIGPKLNSDEPSIFRGQELVTWRFSGQRSAAATALIILKWAVNDLTDPDRRAAINEFWNYWWQCTGQFSSVEQQQSGWTIRNRRITKQLSIIWFDRMIISLFKTLLFHSAAQGRVGTVPIFHTPSLVSFMKSSGCMPMFLLTKNITNNLIFNELSDFKSLDVFTRLFSQNIQQSSKLI